MPRMIAGLLLPMINTHIITCMGLLLLLLLLLSSSLGLFFVVLAADEDSLQDMCVADVVTAIHGNGQHACKPDALVEAEDFVFRGLRHDTTPTNATSSSFMTMSPPYGIVKLLATVREFPGVNTQGMSMVRVDFEPGGLNPPHLHPRASELALVAQGTFYSGFVTTDGRLFARTLEPGDIMVFPRGLVHFQVHIGPGRGILFGSLNSQNPGTQVIPTSLFDSSPSILDQVLLKAFLLTPHQLQSIKARFHNT